MDKAAAGDSLILQPGTYTITYKAAAKIPLPVRR